MIGEDIEQLYQFAEADILPDFLGGEVDEETFLFGENLGKEEEDEESSEE